MKRGKQKSNGFKIIASIGLAFFIIALLGMLLMDENSNNVRPERSKYTVIKFAQSNFNTQFKVLLSKKVDTTELKIIGDSLHAENEKVPKLFIFYYLPGMDTSSVCWATTHYTPDLELEVLDNY